MAEAADEPVEANKLKTCVLKASIHCEGCKRKVKKILSQVQGVDSVDVDTKQQKVTVTGSVDADTLIKKLAKSGKHAQLWPQNPHKRDYNHNNKGIAANGNNKEKLETQETSTKTHHQQQQLNPTASDNAAKVESAAKNSQESKPQLKEAEDGGAKTHDGSDIGGAAAAKANSEAPVKANGGVQEETKLEEEKKSREGCSAVGEAVDKKEASVEKNNGGGGEGSTSGKKKKKKEQSGNLPTSAPLSAFRESENQESSAPHPTNQNIPRNHHYPPPHHYYTPPQPPQPQPEPAYAVSYNTAHPTSSHTTSYYAAPPPYSYAYMHPGPVIEPPPSDPELHPRQPLDSFEIFSDENPNGCSIM